MNVTIETLDSEDNVLFSSTVSGVQLKRNYVTYLSGTMYSATSSASFSVDNAWGEDIEIDF